MLRLLAKQTTQIKKQKITGALGSELCSMSYSFAGVMFEPVLSSDCDDAMMPAYTTAAAIHRCNQSDRL